MSGLEFNLRKNLAAEAKQEPDKEKRRAILESAQNTSEYQQERTATIAERRQKIVDRDAIETAREKLRGGESAETILNGVESFTQTFVEQFPQLNEEGKLNYYLSGSLAVMLLLRSGKFEVLDESRLLEIVSKETIEISPEAAKHLSGFVRKIGDLDYVQTGVYKEQKEREVPKYGEVPDEEYKAARERFLWKGGTKLNGLSEAGSKALKLETASSSLFADPLEEPPKHRVVRVFVGGKEMYIPDPRTMLAYKAVHLGQSFENADKTEKFVSDFDAMLKGMQAIYPREELLKIAHEALCPEKSFSPNSTVVPFSNPQFKGELRKFYEDTIATDADARYLDKLQYGRERIVGVLDILHRYKSPEAKQAVIDFVNRNRDKIDKWDINTTSPRNIEIYADMLMSSHPELISSVSKDSTHEGIMKGIRTNPWAFDKYANFLPDKGVLEMKPANSKTLDILVRLDEANIQQELQDVEELLQFGIDEWNLTNILGAKFVTGEKRHAIFDGLKEARAALNDQDFKSFTYQLQKAVEETRYMDESTGQYVNVSEEERPARVASLFENHGIKFGQS